MVLLVSYEISVIQLTTTSMYVHEKISKFSLWPKTFQTHNNEKQVSQPQKMFSKLMMSWIDFVNYNFSCRSEYPSNRRIFSKMRWYIDDTAKSFWKAFYKRLFFHLLHNKRSKLLWNFPQNTPFISFLFHCLFIKCDKKKQGYTRLIHSICSLKCQVLHISFTTMT